MKVMFQSRLMAEPEGEKGRVSKNIRPNMTGFAQLKLGLSLCTDDKPICQTFISKLLLLALLKTPQHIIFKLGAFQVGFYSM